MAMRRFRTPCERCGLTRRSTRPRCWRSCMAKQPAGSPSRCSRSSGAFSVNVESDDCERGYRMNQWESQIRTNLEDTVYSNILDRGIASTPGTLAAGLVNVRYAEGCLRGPAAEQAPDSELAQLIALSQWLFPPEILPESSSTRAAALARLGQVES